MRCRKREHGVPKTHTLQLFESLGTGKISNSAWGSCGTCARGSSRAGKFNLDAIPPKLGNLEVVMLALQYRRVYIFLLKFNN